MRRKKKETTFNPEPALLSAQQEAAQEAAGRQAWTVQFPGKKVTPVYNLKADDARISYTFMGTTYLVPWSSIVHLSHAE
jgi:hypothetical protein